MEINNVLLLKKLENVLGTSVTTSKGNVAFKCPNCSHHKQKLEINLNTGQYNCWVCHFKGNKIPVILNKAKVHSKLIEDIRNILPKRQKGSKYKVQVKEHIIELPSEFKTLHNVGKYDLMGKRALSYLKERKITKNDLLSYNIGYCEEGEYSGCIIIPSYDLNMNLNYFTARIFARETYINYKNPKVDRDIIGFESRVNFNLPIIFCEGMFDAIAIKRNAIPLLGKTFSKKLKEKIAESAVNKIYIALDKDAMKQSLEHARNLMDNGKEVYLVELDDKDPSDMGFNNFNELIQKVKPMTLVSYMKYRLA